MSISLVKQNDGTWVEKHQHFYPTFTNVFFLFLSRFLTFFIFFWNVFYIYGAVQQPGRNVGRRTVVAQSSCSRMGVEQRSNRSLIVVVTTP